MFCYQCNNYHIELQTLLKGDMIMLRSKYLLRFILMALFLVPIIGIPPFQVLLSQI